MRPLHEMRPVYQWIQNVGNLQRILFFENVSKKNNTLHVLKTIERLQIGLRTRFLKFRSQKYNLTGNHTLNTDVSSASLKTTELYT